MAQPPLHFVISAARSGSTWLARSLNQHPEIMATEQRLFGDFTDVWPQHEGGHSLKITQDAYIRNLSGFYFFEELKLEKREFVREFQDFLIQQMTDFALQRSGKKRIVDKITPYSGTSDRVIRNIRSRLPESKIIQLVRDGRDVLTSGTFDWLRLGSTDTPRHAFFMEHVPGMELTRFFDDATIEQWATDWRDTIEIFQRKAPDLQIRYEALLTGQGRELQRIFETLDVTASKTLADHCAAATTFRQLTGRETGDERPTEKARKGISGDWKNYFTRRDGELFQQIAGAELQALGYTSDGSWVNALPEHLSLKHPAP